MQFVGESLNNIIIFLPTHTLVIALNHFDLFHKILQWHLVSTNIKPQQLHHIRLSSESHHLKLGQIHIMMYYEHLLSFIAATLSSPNCHMTRTTDRLPKAKPSKYFRKINIASKVKTTTTKNNYVCIYS